MGLFDSLFGGGNDYGAGADKQAALGAYNQMGDIGSSLWGVGQQNLNQWSQDNARARTSLNNYANYLQQDPFTDARDSADLNRATAGSAQAYARANANLQSQLAARGLDTASNANASSLMAGGLTGLAGMQANEIAGAQNQLAYNRIAQRQQNLAQLTSLYGGQAGQDLQGGLQFGNEAGSLFGNEANGYSNLYGRDLEAQAQDSNGLLGLLGAGASALGDYYGFQAGKGMFNKSSGKIG